MITFQDLADRRLVVQRLEQVDLRVRQLDEDCRHTVITLWQGAIILETVFNWPGLGRAYFQAIGLYDTPVIVGNTVIYAYLLAITVFLLDFIYVDAFIFI